MAIKIKLKNSVTQDAVPTGTHLPEVGELAVNANINSIGGYMRASDNSIVKIFGPGSVSTPAASTTAAGIAELATSAETTTGTDTARVCTPAGVKAVTDAERTTSNNTYLALSGGTLVGVLQATAGSNSAPAIHFGDSDSGIYGGTNTVSLTAGGTDRLKADANGIGIGTNGTSGFPLSILSAGSTGNAIALVGDATNEESKIFFRNNANDANKAWIKNDGAELDLVGGFGGALSFQINSSEKVRVDSSGRLLIGMSSAIDVANNSFSHLQMAWTDKSASMGISRFSANTSPPIFNFGKARGGTVGTMTIVQENDDLGEINFCGADGVDLKNISARIRVAVDDAPAVDDIPGRFEFFTFKASTNTLTEALRITNDGIVRVPDNGKFTAGGSNDLSIFHDADSSYIEHTTSGTDLVIDAKSPGDDLILRAADDVNIRVQGNEDAIKCIGDGAVQLFYDSSTHANPKFTTSATGATITGTLVADGLTVDTNTLHVDATNNRVGIGTTGPVGNLETRDATRTNIIIAKTGLTVKQNSDLHTSYDTVQLGAGGYLASYSAAAVTADTHLGHNLYRHSGATWKRRYQDTAMRFRMNSPANSFIWERAATGLADADITWLDTMKLDGSGHLGLGVSPSAWATNGDFKALQVGTGFAAFGRGSGDQDRGGIAVNYYHDGTNERYIADGHSNRIYMNDGNIDFQYAGENTSSAGAVLTFTSGIRMLASGNVAIGQTQAAVALDVQGGTSNTGIAVRSTDTRAQVSYVDNATTGLGCVATGGEGDDFFIRTGSDGAKKLTIKANGSIAAGTAGGTYSLELENKIGGADVIMSMVNSTANEDCGIRITGSHTGVGTRTSKIGHTIVTSGTGLQLHSPDNIVLYTGSTATERLRIDDNGIKFQGDTASTNALNDYEIGNHSTTDLSGAGLTFTYNNTGVYTKVGAFVHFSFDITYPSTSDGSDAKISAPYQADQDNHGGGVVGYTSLDKAVLLHINTGGVFLRDKGFSNLSNAQCSGRRFIGQLTFRAS